MKKTLGMITILLGRELPTMLSDQHVTRQRMSEVYAKRLEESKRLGIDMVLTEWHGKLYPHTGRPITELRDPEHWYTVSLGFVLRMIEEGNVPYSCRLVQDDNKSWKLEFWFKELHPDTEVVDASAWIRQQRESEAQLPIKGVWVNTDQNDEQTEWINLVIGSKPEGDARPPDVGQMKLEVVNSALTFTSRYVRKRTSFGQKVEPGKVEGLYQDQRDKEDAAAQAAAAEAAKHKRFHGTDGLAAKVKGK